jgi:putative membrane protein insertion efficiency factor
MSNRTIRFAFRVYKSVLSPLLHTISPSRCLYLPTCSEYAYTAVIRFGWIRGSWLALRRLARCHPWGKGGLDPVPQRDSPHPVQSNSSGCNQKDADHLP